MTFVTDGNLTGTARELDVEGSATARLVAAGEAIRTAVGVLLTLVSFR